MQPSYNPLAGHSCVGHGPGSSLWCSVDWFWLCSFQSKITHLNGSFTYEFFNYLVIATLFPLQFLFFGLDISGSFSYSSLQMFSNSFTFLLALFGTCFCFLYFLQVHSEPNKAILQVGFTVVEWIGI